MIEIIKEAGTILKDLPDLAIWILIGILFYKVFVLGSFIGLAKFFINKFHDYLTKPKEVITKTDIEGLFISHDGTYRRFREFIKNELVCSKGGDYSKYVHSRDLDLFIDAVKYYKENVLNSKKK